MRISDWSSDVCSSDLVTQNLNQFFGDAVMQEAVFFEAFVAGAEKLNAALVALAALADRDDGDCAHQAQQRAFYALVALVRALERGFGDAVNDRLADPLPGVGNQQIVDSAIGAGEGGQLDNIDRSEEHTYELQSLMRISYAVFCLKKKKTTKDKTSDD